MGNSIAYAALLGWPLISAILFATRRTEQAVIWSVTLSYLFLPSGVEVDLPGLPAFNRVTIPNLSILLLFLLRNKGGRSMLPSGTGARILVIMMLVGPFFTAVSNMDVVHGPNLYLPGLSLYDSVSAVVRSLLLLVPFLVARACLGTLEAQREIVRAFMVCGLIYSVFMLIETIEGPNFHIRLYGFFQHVMSQHVRWGGWRPIVFMPHGLWTSFFAFLAVASAVALWKTGGTLGNASEKIRGRSKLAYATATAYLGIVLILAKSMGALMYGMLAVPLVMLTKARFVLRIAVIIAMVAVAYPALRGLYIFPVSGVLAAANAVSTARGASLHFRFGQEERLLDRAKVRPVFGWGGWGRNRVYNDRGEDISVTDGYWIILIGTNGWVGFIATFGLLTLPIFALRRRLSHNKNEDLSPITATLCLMLALNVLDLLPNAVITPWTWMLAGALLGFAERTEDAANPVAEAAADAKPTRPRTIL